MTTKPDRFERMISKYANRGMPDYDEFVLADHEVIKLLRKEHRAVVRMVQGHNRSIQEFPDNELDPQWKAGYERACAEIVNKLTERAK